LCDIVPYRNKHVAVILKLRPIADRLAMTGDDDRRICRGVQVGLRRGDHPVDAASRRIVDEGINPVPVSVGGMKDVLVSKAHRNVAICMGWAIILEYEI